MPPPACGGSCPRSTSPRPSAGSGRCSRSRSRPCATTSTVETPSLIRGYLRCGAELLGPPACDPEFGTADLPMLMTLDGLPRRHRRHFLGQADD